MNQRQKMNERQKDEKEKTAAKQNPRSCEKEKKGYSVGTFGGEEDHVVRTRDGEAVAGDTGDQAGGQN
jgi:hypothetical protein